MKLTLSDLIDLVAEVKALEEEAWEQGYAVGSLAKPTPIPMPCPYPVNSEQP